MRQIRVLILLILTALLLCGCTGEMYSRYRYPGENTFGKSLLSEVDHKMTVEEYRIGIELVMQMNAVLSYDGPEADAASDVGALSRYYWFPYYSRPAKVLCSVQLVNCVRHDDSCNVWVAYSVERYDGAGGVESGSWDVLSLLTVSPDG